ncbi:MAG: hypothetical protein DCC65_07445 [Planctomycetota bacterium]|nr:MAG: hypothetical protein DCC65_07445 [Planctomycetota bacterium]
MRGKRPYRIVVAEPYAPQAIARLREVGEVHILEDSAPQTILSAIEDCDALLVRNKAHVTARIIDAATNLKVIARASSNVDHIDLRAAGRRNISVVYAPHVAVTSTAQFALAMIMTLHRRLPLYDRQLREGHFESLRAPQGRDLGHSTLGILGIEPAAEHLARMCRSAFGTPIIFHDPLERRRIDMPGDEVGLEDLLARSDILSVHLPSQPETKHFLDAARLATLKQTAVLVNVSRGSVIDTTALAQALRRGQLAGAGLDVFEVEPLPPQHPIRRAPNCILTPHVAGATLDAADDRYSVADDVVRILQGQSPLYSLDMSSAKTPPK